jgi:peptide/nickel transport system substrate-binding protein
MKRFSCAFLALASALAMVCARPMAARPRYGGTLRVAVHAALRTLDPSDTPANGAAGAARARLAGLAIETLVRLDEHGRFHPALAESWQTDSQGRRWDFRIRSGVRTHDGETLGAASVAAALERLDAGWTVRADAGVVRVEPASPAPDLLWELADPRAGIAIVTGAQVVGTGPFRIERWEPGRQAVLRAHEDYWGGRPFLDAIQVDMGRRPPDQLADLELGRADIVSVQPQDVRRIEQRGLRAVSTAPIEVVALVVGDARSGTADDRARKALAQSIDRSALAVLLQRRAEPAGGVLPQWLSGYAFLLRPETDRTAARTSAQALMPAARAWRLQVDPNDAVLQALAGRLVLDAREAGLSVSLAALGSPGPLVDARLVRRFVPVASPERALRLLLPDLGLSPGAGGSDEARVGAGTPEAAWRLESSVVDRHLVIPLVHLPELFGVGPRVAGWPGPSMEPPGGLRLERAWLRGDHP